jgi:type IV secretory pathway VirB9-like protein
LDKSLDNVKPLPLKLNLKDAQPISLSVEEELPKKVVQWGDNTEHVFDNNNSIIQNNVETKLNTIEKDIQDIKSKLVEILSLLQK